MKEKEKPWLDLWLILSVGILAILVLYVIKRNKCIKDRSCCANDDEEDDVEQVWALPQSNTLPSLLVHLMVSSRFCPPFDSIQKTSQ